MTVSAGGQRTLYGLGDGKYLTDLSFVTSSYSFGFGAKIKVAKNAHLNIDLLLYQLFKLQEGIQ